MHYCSLDPQFIQPPDNPYTVTFDDSTDSVQLICSLNIDIPSSVTVTWLHNSNRVNLKSSDAITQADNTATLIIGNPQAPNIGEYRCSFTGFDQEVVVRIIQLG